MKESYILKVAHWSRNEKNPICTFLVGLVAQDVIKITGKYIPIQQWLRFDFFEIVDNLPDNCNRELLNSRYDDCLQIYTLLQTNKINYMRCSAINLGISDYDIFNPEEARYITNK